MEKEAGKLDLKSPRAGSFRERVFLWHLGQSCLWGGLPGLSVERMNVQIHKGAFS